jgi:ABC-type transport system involved in multi-copper enzyme maturation permease subunit
MPEPENSSSSAFAALIRVRLVAAHTLTEALRLRVAWLLAAVGGLLVLMAQWLREFNFGAAELKFVADFGLGAVGLTGAVLAALAMAHLYFRDIEGGVAAMVLTRRVRRGEYLAGKLAGVLALLALFVLVLGLLLGGMIVIRETQLGVAFIPVPLFLQACALVWLKLALVAAMTLFVCSYGGSALFASGAGLLLSLVAQLRPFTAGEGSLVWLRLWPNLGLFDAESLLTGTVPTAAALFGVIGYWAAFMLLFTVLATYVFRRREF